MKTAMSSFESIKKTMGNTIEKQTSLSSKHNIPVVPALKYRKANTNVNRGSKGQGGCNSTKKTAKRQKKKKRDKKMKTKKVATEEKKNGYNEEEDDIDDVIDVKENPEAQQKLIYEKELRKRSTRAIASFLQHSKRLTKLKLSRTGIDDLMCSEMVKVTKLMMKQKKVTPNKVAASNEEMTEFLDLYLNNVTRVSHFKFTKAAAQLLSSSR